MNKKLTVSVLALSLLAVPSAVSQLGNATGIAALQAMPDPLTLMQSRSPGARPAGWKTTKGPRLSIPLEPRKPHVEQPGEQSRILVSDQPLAFERPSVFTDTSLNLPVEPFAPVALTSLSDLGSAVASRENSKSLQGTPVLGGGISTVPISVVPVTTPVPEPATWAMMLLGFLLIGFAMRRNQTASPECRIPAR